jgi:glycosyltransferase involved in cell wall biosynthesis
MSGHPGASDCADLLAGALAVAAARPGAGLGSGPAMSVVVTTLNEGAHLDRLLDELVPQLEPDDELIVVDGGSTDDTADLAKAWAGRDPRIRPMRRPGTNIPEGRNAGIGMARNPFLACTDVGCTPSPGWLAALRSSFAERHPPALVSGVYRVSAKGAMQHAVAVACYPDPDRAGRGGVVSGVYGRLFGRAFDPTMPTGRSVAFAHEAWKAVQGFPEHLDTAEDVTFGRAVAATGRRCVLSRDAEVEWEQRPTIRATARMYFRYGVGGGLSGDPKVIGRDLLRAAAYVAGALLLIRGGRVGRAAAATGGAAYLSLPMWRSRRRPRPLEVAALVPAALALKDLAKAAGCLTGLVRVGRRRSAAGKPGVQPDRR